MLKEEFLQRIKKTSTCWLWQGSKDKSGYGQVGTTFFKTRKAHRVAYLLFIGPIPDGLCICHKCDNPPCVNPQHLFVGTYKDNVQDSLKKGRMNTNLAKITYRKGERNQAAVLTEEQVAEIRDLYLTGDFKQIDLAKQFGVGQAQISRIIRKTSWTIKEESK